MHKKCIKIDFKVKGRQLRRNSKNLSNQLSGNGQKILEQDKSCLKKHFCFRHALHATFAERESLVVTPSFSLSSVSRRFCSAEETDGRNCSGYEILDCDISRNLCKTEKHHSSAFLCCFLKIWSPATRIPRVETNPMMKYCKRISPPSKQQCSQQPFSLAKPASPS